MGVHLSTFEMWKIKILRDKRHAFVGWDLPGDVKKTA